jgi:hypothetical protein
VIGCNGIRRDPYEEDRRPAVHRHPLHRSAGSACCLPDNLMPPGAALRVATAPRQHTTPVDNAIRKRARLAFGIESRAGCPNPWDRRNVDRACGVSNHT